jgi:hypothetical protein
MMRRRVLQGYGLESVSILTKWRFPGLNLIQARHNADILREESLSTVDSVTSMSLSDIWMWLHRGYLRYAIFITIHE